MRLPPSILHPISSRFALHYSCSTNALELLTIPCAAVVAALVYAVPRLLGARRRDGVFPLPERGILYFTPANTLIIGAKTMGKSRHQRHDPEPEAAGADKKALRRVEEARTAYAKAEERVATLRARLTRAEEKLVRRTTRLAKVEDALAALANERADMTAEQQTPDTTMAVADIDGATPSRADDDRAVVVAAPDTAQLSVQAIDGLAPVAGAAGDGANGGTPRRSRSRRAPSTKDHEG